ncbi:MAG: PD40 domain-containing protein [Planctomycetes bacterium]|nr:PD40 domain-containing protein [Planctomycetota bacterium]
MKLPTTLSLFAIASLILLAVPLPGQKKGGGGGTTPPPDPAIAFVESGIKVMNADGSNVRTVVSLQRGEWADYPSWSPDGQQLVFWAVLGGQQGIFKVNVDGSGLQFLAPQSGFAHPTDWSRLPCPDGRYKIAFLSEMANGYCDLFVVNTDGTGLQNLTNSPEHELTATWTRDASGLYVGWTTWEGPPGGEGGDLVQLGVLTGGGVQVTSVTPVIGEGFLYGCSVAHLSDELFVEDFYMTNWTVADATVLPWTPAPSGISALFIGVPRFSPDDSRIVLRNDGGRATAGIYVGSADGSGLVRIRSSGGWPVWRHNP